MADILETELEKFASGNLHLKVEQVQFKYKNIVLAEAAGTLRTSVNGSVELYFEERVQFTRTQEFDVIEVDSEIEVVGNIAGCRMYARPANSFSSLDFFIDTGSQYPIPFQQVVIESQPLSDKIVEVSGYLNAFPHHLAISSESGSAQFKFKDSALDVFGEIGKNGQYLKIIPGSDENRLPEFIAETSAFCLSVLAGRRCAWRGFIQKDNTGASRLFINSAVVRTTNFYAPFYLSPFKNEFNEKIFFQAHTYIRSNSNSQMLRQLVSLWESTGTDFDARCVLLGIAIEGVSKSVKIKKKPKEESEYELFKSKALKAFEPYLDGSKQIESLDQDEIARFVGVVTNTSVSNAKERIQLASNAVGFEIRPEQLDAWGKIRNRRGHGTFGLQRPSGQEWQLYLECVDLMNFLCLSIMGFTEPKVFRRWFRPFLSAAAPQTRIVRSEKGTVNNKSKS